MGTVQHYERTSWCRGNADMLWWLAALARCDHHAEDIAKVQVCIHNVFAVRVSDSLFRVTYWGTSPRYCLELEASRVIPREKFDLSALRMVTTTGSTLTADQFRWFYKVFPDVHLSSVAGGTDIATSCKSILCFSLFPYFESNNNMVWCEKSSHWLGFCTLHCSPCMFPRVSMLKLDGSQTWRRYPWKCLLEGFYT